MKSGAGGLSFLFGSGAGEGEPSRGAGEGAPVEAAAREARADLEGAGAGPASEAAKAEAFFFFFFFLWGGGEPRARGVLRLSLSPERVWGAFRPSFVANQGALSFSVFLLEVQEFINSSHRKGKKRGKRGSQKGSGHGQGGERNRRRVQKKKKTATNLSSSQKGKKHIFQLTDQQRQAREHERSAHHSGEV